jgi:hypothetical protein
VSKCKVAIPELHIFQTLFVKRINTIYNNIYFKINFICKGN